MTFVINKIREITCGGEDACQFKRRGSDHWHQGGGRPSCALGERGCDCGTLCRGDAVLGNILVGSCHRIPRFVVRCR